MTERRYSEDEVAAIFERAAEAQHTGQDRLPSGEGMTLAQLQDIGGEVGIAPELVAQAAAAIERGAASPARSFLGFPIGVGRTVQLNHRLSEEEWERLIVDLRETFDARGKVSADGAFRQWTNGNLQALLEPTPTGHRLRLQTVKGDARGLMMAGLGMLGIAASLFIAALATDTVGGHSAEFIMLAAMGLGLFGLGALRLPRWARLRRGQMEGIARRLALAEPPQSADPTPAENSR